MKIIESWVRNGAMLGRKKPDTFSPYVFNFITKILFELTAFKKLNNYKTKKPWP